MLKTRQKNNAYKPIWNSFPEIAFFWVQKRFRQKYAETSSKTNEKHNMSNIDVLVLWSQKQTFKTNIALSTVANKCQNCLWGQKMTTSKTIQKHKLNNENLVANTCDIEVLFLWSQKHSKNKHIKNTKQKHISKTLLF